MTRPTVCAHTHIQQPCICVTYVHDFKLHSTSLPEGGCCGGSSLPWGWTACGRAQTCPWLCPRLADCHQLKQWPSTSCQGHMPGPLCKVWSSKSETPALSQLNLFAYDMYHVSGQTIIPGGDCRSHAGSQQIIQRCCCTAEQLQCSSLNQKLLSAWSC